MFHYLKFFVLFLFLAVTAEEAGLRGSEYYAQHPLAPLNKTALDLNFDAFYPFGRTKDVSVSGAERTTSVALAVALPAGFVAVTV